MGLGFTLHEFRRRKPTALSLKVSISFFCERYPTPTPLLHPDQQNAISAKKKNFKSSRLYFQSFAQNCLIYKLC